MDTSASSGVTDQIIFFSLLTVVNENVSLVISRQLLTDFCTHLPNLPDATAKAVYHFTLEKIQPRVISFEEQVNATPSLLIHDNIKVLALTRKWAFTSCFLKFVGCLHQAASSNHLRERRRLEKCCPGFSWNSPGNRTEVSHPT